MADRSIQSCSKSIAAGRSSGAGYTANIQITNAGHVVTWQYDGLTLTEVAARHNIRCRSGGG